jgi:hypothetical protein
VTRDQGAGHNVAEGIVHQNRVRASGGRRVGWITNSSHVVPPDRLIVAFLSLNQYSLQMDHHEQVSERTAKSRLRLERLGCRHVRAMLRTMLRTQAEYPHPSGDLRGAAHRPQLSLVRCWALKTAQRIRRVGHFSGKPRVTDGVAPAHPILCCRQ